jgi:phosphoglycerate dehydrogenase-like enzyme
MSDTSRATPGAPAPGYRIAILDDYLRASLEAADWDALGAMVTVFDEPIGDPDALVATLEPFDVVCAMRERTALPAAVLSRLPNLRLLVTTGMQNAAIDLDAARAAGIVVCGTGSSPAATAELTWALILGAARDVAANDRTMRAGGWQRRAGLALAGRRLGVVGLGKNGARVATIGRAFGMDVVAWSQHLTDDLAAEVGVTRVDFDDLLATSDVVTIHLRLSDRTAGLFDDAAFARMRPEAILVNTSRGPIIDEAALIRALDAGRLRSAAIDVYDEEPLPSDHPLRGRDDVLLSPHMGYVSDENVRRFYQETVEDIAAWVAGDPIRVL